MISSGTKLTEDYILGCVKDVMQLCKQKRMENISQASQGRPCRPKYYKCQKFRYKAVKYLNQQQEDDNSGNQSSNSQGSWGHRWGSRWGSLRQNHGGQTAEEQNIAQSSDEESGNCIVKEYDYDCEIVCEVGLDRRPYGGG